MENDVTVSVFERLADTLQARKTAAPASSYAASLFTKGQDAILKKLGEETIETVLAAKSNDKAALIHEMADLWFHCLVLLAHEGLNPRDVAAELARREGVSGHAEKSARKATS